MSTIYAWVVRITWLIIYLELIALGVACFVYVESNATAARALIGSWNVVFFATEMVIVLCILHIGIFTEMRREMGGGQTTEIGYGYRMTWLIVIARIFALLTCQFSLFLLASLLQQVF